jgi:hypothetical protein
MEQHECRFLTKSRKKIYSNSIWKAFKYQLMQLFFCNSPGSAIPQVWTSKSFTACTSTRTPIRTKQWTWMPIPKIKKINTIFIHLLSWKNAFKYHIVSVLQLENELRFGLVLLVYFSIHPFLNENMDRVPKKKQ